jgi:hypothetical protein
MKNRRSRKGDLRMHQMNLMTIGLYNEPVGALLSEQTTG